MFLRASFLVAAIAVIALVGPRSVAGNSAPAISAPQVVAVSAEPPRGEPPRIELPRAVEGLLENGLRVVVVPRAGETALAVHLAFDGGASVEAPNGRGAAQLAMATLASCDGAGVAALASASVRVSHSADAERAELAVLAKRDALDRVVAAFAAALGKCKYEDADLAKGRAALKAAGSDAGSRATGLALETMFERAAVLRGADAGLAKAVDGAAVRTYAHAHLRPADATLVIVGDLDPGATFLRVREAFASVARVPQSAFEPATEPAFDRGPRRATASVAKGRATCVAFPSPDRDRDDSAALALAVELLRVRFPQARIEHRESMHGAGCVLATLVVEGDALAAVSDFEAGVLGFAESLDPARLDLTASRFALATRIVRDLAGLDSLARRIARDTAELEDGRAIEREYAAMLAATPEAVVAAAKRWLAPQRAVVAAVGPTQESAAPETTAATRGNYENGPEWVVDRQPGTGHVAIAFTVPIRFAVGDVSSPARNGVWAKCVAAVLEAHGGFEVTTTFDSRSFTVSGAVLASRAEEALTALLDPFRGKQASRDRFTAETIAAAQRDAQHELDARRCALAQRVVWIASGAAQLESHVVDAECQPSDPAAWFRLDRARLAVVGDCDPAVVARLGNDIPAAPTPEGTAALPPSIRPPAGIVRGDSSDRATWVARVMPLAADDVSIFATLPQGRALVAELKELGLADTAPFRGVEIATPYAFTSEHGEIRTLVVAAEVAAADVDRALANFDALADALARRGITEDDGKRAAAAHARAEFERSLTPVGRALALAAPTVAATVDVAAATAALRGSLGATAQVVVLVPGGTGDVTPGPRPARGYETPATIPELEAVYGKNLLTPDPALPHGYGPPPGSKEIAVLRRWYGDPPPTMNGVAGNADANVVDSLCEYVAFAFAPRHTDDPSRFAPGVAEYASWSADHKIVTVRIRGDVTWQFPAVDRADPRYEWLLKPFAAGAPSLTARDVEFTHRVFMDPGAQSGGLRGALAGTRVVVLDDRTYQVIWDTPTINSFAHSVNFQTILPEFLYSRDEAGVPFPPELLGRGVADHWYNNRMCGYGPYEFVRMDPNERIVLRRKDDFPICKPAVVELRWEILRDPEQVVMRLIAGTLDAITLQPQQYKKYWLDAKDGEGVRQDRFQPIPYQRAEYFFIGWNTRRPELADPAVRRALDHAVNREAILNRAFFAAGELVNGPLRREHPDYLDLPFRNYDLDAAATLLEEAGWKDVDDDGVLEKEIDGKDTEFRISFTTFAGSAEGDMIAAVLKDDFAKLGIELSVISLPWPQMREAVFAKHDYDAYLGNWGTSYEVDLRAMYHSQNAEDGLNYGGYSNPEVDELAVAHTTAFDRAKQREIAHRFQRVIRDDPPYTYLLRRERMTVLTKSIANVRYSPYRPQLLSLDWCGTVE